MNKLEALLELVRRKRGGIRHKDWPPNDHFSIEFNNGVPRLINKAYLIDYHHAFPRGFAIHEFVIDEWELYENESEEFNFTEMAEALSNDRSEEYYAEQLGSDGSVLFVNRGMGIRQVDENFRSHNPELELLDMEQIKGTYLIKRRPKGSK